MAAAFENYDQLLSRMEPVSISDASTTGPQPSSMPAFHFGLQPAGLKDIDNPPGGKRARVMVVGTGDVYPKFVQWALEHRGTEVFAAEKDDPASKKDPKTARQKLEAVGIDQAHQVASLDKMPPDIDYMVVLTPAHIHAPFIKEAQERGIPVMVEKPLVAQIDEMTREGGLDDQLKAAKAPVYAMDWEVLLATPLMKALDMNVPFAETVEVTKGKGNAFSEFNKGEITHVEATFLEGASVGHSSIKAAREARPDAFDITHGGGALYDMGVHPLDALAAMGFMPGKINEVTLGDPMDGRPGHYSRIGNDDMKTAEFYAEVNMETKRNGRNIPTMIETGKAGDANDMRIRLENERGMVLNWEYMYSTPESPHVNRVTMFNKRDERPDGKVPENKIIARAESHADPYALMFEQATRFFEEEKGRGDAAKAALFYPEYKAVLAAVKEMHALGRAQKVDPEEVITQRTLRDKVSPLVDLAQASVVPEGRRRSAAS